jgi:hypothetical protein
VRQDTAEALRVGRIAEWRTARVNTHNQVETQNAGDARGIHDREPRELSPFEPTDLGCRHTHHSTQRGLTERGADSCLTGLIPKLSEAPVPAPCSSIESSLD